MKPKLILLNALMFAGMVAVKAQEVPTPVAPVAPVSPVAPVEPEDPEFIEAGDTTRLKFGNIRMIIIEDPEENDNHGHKKDTSFIEIPDEPRKSHSTWSGFYLGVNGLLSYDNKLTLPAGQEFLELDYSRSITAGLNFADLEVNIIKNYFQFSTGLGIQWNRYALKNNYDLSYTSDTLIGTLNSAVDYSRNLLKATYLQIPLMFEIHTHKYHKKALHIGFGVVGGYKLGSRVKQKFTLDGDDTKVKTKGSYQLSPFQAYLHGRIGFGNVTLFANYGITRAFEKGQGPQNYPVTVGIYLPLH